MGDPYCQTGVLHSHLMNPGSLSTHKARRGRTIDEIHQENPPTLPGTGHSKRHQGQGRYLRVVDGNHSQSGGTSCRHLIDQIRDDPLDVSALRGRQPKFRRQPRSEANGAHTELDRGT